MKARSETNEGNEQHQRRQPFVAIRLEHSNTVWHETTATTWKETTAIVWHETVETIWHQTAGIIQH